MNCLNGEPGDSNFGATIKTSIQWTPQDNFGEKSYFVWLIMPLWGLYCHIYGDRYNPNWL